MMLIFISLNGMRCQNTFFEKRIGSKYNHKKKLRRLQTIEPPESNDAYELTFKNKFKIEDGLITEIYDAKVEYYEFNASLMNLEEI